MVQTLSPMDYLRPEFVEGVINKKLEAQLDFLNVFPRQQTDALSFAYMTDLVNAGDDILSGVMGKPTEIGEITDLDEISVSTIDQQFGAMKRFGYKLKFSQDQLREEAYVDEIMRGYDRAVFGMAAKMNADIIAALEGCAALNSITEVDGEAAWSAEASNPAKDILMFRKAFKQETYPYRLTDMYVHSDNYYEALAALQSTDIAWVQSPLEANLELPKINGVQLHELYSSELAEGSYIGIDAKNPALTIYEHRNPKFSSIEGGMVGVQRYEEQGFPNNIVIEIIAERGIAPKLPNAAMYKASAI